MLTAWLESSVTVLVPSVMQALVVEFGTPELQFPAFNQLLLPSVQVDTVPVSVHWPNAAA